MSIVKVYQFLWVHLSLVAFRVELVRDLIALFPDHCLSFHLNLSSFIYIFLFYYLKTVYINLKKGKKEKIKNTNYMEVHRIPIYVCR